MDHSIEMIGVLRPKAEKVVKQLFSDVAKAVEKRESGCQIYTIYVQKSSAVPSVIIHEKYADQKALDDHLRSEYLVEAAGILDTEDLLTEPLQLADVFVERVAEFKRERGWKGPGQIGQ